MDKRTLETIKLEKSDINDFKNFINSKGVTLLERNEIKDSIELIYNTNQKFILSKELESSLNYNPLIFGKDQTDYIVSIEVNDNIIEVFKEVNGKLEVEIKPNLFWLITHQKVSSKQTKLKGNQYYSWIATFETREEFLKARSNLKKQNIDYYSIYNPKEAALIFNGMTYYKNLKPSDISILSFDIEADGLVESNNSEVYIITNTFRKNGKTIKKGFYLEEYASQAEMLENWCKWVRECDPSLIIGHNIYGYDFKYLYHVASLNNTNLNLGRNGSSIVFNEYTSSKRKDGSQSYDYKECFIYGREIVDTFFLALTYDIKREFESYGLKSIINQLGLEKQNRVFVDASKIKEYYNNRHKDPEMWQKVKDYALDDSEDALKLFDKMIASTFYFSQSVSKSFQQMINSATGSQFNNMMVRSYLQEGHSIAKADEVQKFEGAISFGRPGLYQNVYKLDVKSLYPSIILQYNIYNKNKDPEANFLKIMRYFTDQRLKDKEIAEKTGSSYYNDLQESRKVGINTGYGFLGASGLNYNSPFHAAEVTKYGREILNKGVLAATSKDLNYWIPKNDKENDESDNE